MSASAIATTGSTTGSTGLATGAQNEQPRIPKMAVPAEAPPRIFRPTASDGRNYQVLKGESHLCTLDGDTVKMVKTAFEKLFFHKQQLKKLKNILSSHAASLANDNCYQQGSISYSSYLAPTKAPETVAEPRVQAYAAMLQLEIAENYLETIEGPYLNTLDGLKKKLQGAAYVGFQETEDPIRKCDALKQKFLKTTKERIKQRAGLIRYRAEELIKRTESKALPLGSSLNPEQRRDAAQLELSATALALEDLDRDRRQMATRVKELTQLLKSSQTEISSSAKEGEAPSTGTSSSSSGASSSTAASSSSSTGMSSSLSASAEGKKKTRGRAGKRSLV